MYLKNYIMIILDLSQEWENSSMLEDLLIQFTHLQIKGKKTYSIRHKSISQEPFMFFFNGKLEIEAGFPDSSVGKESTCNAGDIRDVGSIPGLGRSPGEGHGNLLSLYKISN